MSVERKCPSCKQWNKDEDYCVACGTILSPQIIEENREKERELTRTVWKKTKVDIFFEKWKNTRFLPLKIIYYIFYSAWMIVMGVAFLFAYLTVGVNG
ncbi:MAG: hypothetical protein M9916_09015 [Crocinitomicaceae bacterium]|nr:hypothetical protein [Crocinitomicaceae bacterium]